MLRVAALFVFLGLVLQPAIAQISSTGVPASALSPTLDNRHTPIPAGATSPRSFPFIVEPFPTVQFPTVQVFRASPVHTFPTRSFSVAPVDPRLRPFGFHNHRQFVPIPVFYPIYGGGYDYSAYPPVADPMVNQPADAPSAESDASVARSEDALRQAYLQGARDALAEEQRGRQDARDVMASRSAPAKPKPTDDTAKPPEPDNSPAAVFIFKDGHQIETKNYAIMGQTLYDISGSVVRKVSLADLDTAATIKANDDRGITVKLP